MKSFTIAETEGKRKRNRGNGSWKSQHTKIGSKEAEMFRNYVVHVNFTDSECTVNRE